MPTHAFSDLDHVIDEVHALFDAWTEAGTFDGALSEAGLEVMRLAVHEWIANLVQHAVFPDETRIELSVGVETDGVRCRIADSSCGFDFVGQIERQQAVFEAPAPSERGRGLLMLVTSTDDLGFVAAGPNRRQAVSFVVRDPDSAFFADLYRPEDLADDPSLARSLGDGQAGHVPDPARPPSPDPR